MKKLHFAFPALALFAATEPALAATYYYVDWTEADVEAGTAHGTITLPDQSVVTVDFEAIEENGEPGNLYNAQTDDVGTNFFDPVAPYESAEVENAPPSSDILQLAGGQNQTYVVTLSEPIKDPIMALVSLGQAGTETTYDFDSPFTIVSQGVGWWGGSDTALSQLEGDILSGHEGSGTIQFIGTFSEFSWVVPTPESWHGFTFGIRTTEALEPPPPAEGGAGGSAGSGPGETGEAGEAGAGGTGAVSLGGGGTGGALDGEAGQASEVVDEEPRGGGRSGTTDVPEAGTGGNADSLPEPGAGAQGGKTPAPNSPDDGVESDVECSCSVPGSPAREPLGIAALLFGVSAMGWRRRARHQR